MMVRFASAPTLAWLLHGQKEGWRKTESTRYMRESQPEITFTMRKDGGHRTRVRTHHPIGRCLAESQIFHRFPRGWKSMPARRGEELIEEADDDEPAAPASRSEYAVLDKSIERKMGTITHDLNGTAVYAYDMGS